MPLPKPRSGETQSSFVGRCISAETKASPGRDAEQVQAMCFQAWKDRGKEDVPVFASGGNRLREDTVPDGQGRCTFDVDFSEAEFDQKNKLLVKNVAWLGSKSKNGYTYTQEALRKAQSLFEGVKLFINHPSKEEESTGRRDVMKLAGIGTRPRFVEGKLRGDAELLPDTWGEKFWNIAKLMPEAAGMSQNATGKMKKGGDGAMQVEEITKVFSVDLVANPATTSSMFESNGKNKQEISAMDYKDIDLKELRIRRADIVDALMLEGEKNRDDEVRTFADALKVMKTKVDEFEVKEERMKLAATVDKLLEASKLPKEAKTEVFKQTLMDAADDDTRKKLIEDRKALVGGVKNAGGEQQLAEGEGKPLKKEEALAALHSR
jgi:hypothetical protein